MTTSKSMRENPLFTRNMYQSVGKYGIPYVKKQNIDLSNINLIAFSDIRQKLSLFDKLKGIHFFIDDYMFEKIYNYPDKSLNKIKRYKFVLTPDFSIYIDMPKWKQIENVAKNRWCGAYWQEQGLEVIPTVSWALASSFDFCFDGIETGSTVAIGTVGCKKEKLNFMRGYDKMLEKINPKNIICYGKPFFEMQGNIIQVPYFRDTCSST